MPNRQNEKKGLIAGLWGFIVDFATNNPLPTLIIFILLVIAGSMFTYYAVEITSTPAFCSSCHEMKPAYESWKTSTHYNVKAGKKPATCRDCHIPPWNNPIEVLISKTYHGIKDVTRHYTESEEFEDDGYYYNMRIRAPHGMVNSSCLQCHSDIYKKDYKTDANIHEVLKRNKKNKCVDCHKDMVHDKYKPSDYKK